MHSNWPAPHCRPTPVQHWVVIGCQRLRLKAVTKRIAPVAAFAETTPMMTLLTQTYLIYVVISVAVTIWVARTLHRRGRVFLVNSFHGDELVADSINDLLVVGFYLLNFGYVALALRYGQKPNDVQEAVEFLATKIGLVLVILAAMHFLNLLVFSKIGGRTKFRPKSPAESPSLSLD
jgi:hypothetical protein